MHHQHRLPAPAGRAQLGSQQPPHVVCARHDAKRDEDAFKSEPQHQLAVVAPQRRVHDGGIGPRDMLACAGVSGWLQLLLTVKPILTPMQGPCGTHELAVPPFLAPAAPLPLDHGSLRYRWERAGLTLEACTQKIRNRLFQQLHLLIVGREADVAGWQRAAPLI